MEQVAQLRFTSQFYASNHECLPRQLNNSLDFHANASQVEPFVYLSNATKARNVATWIYGPMQGTLTLHANSIGSQLYAVGGYMNGTTSKATLLVLQVPYWRISLFVLARSFRLAVPVSFSNYTEETIKIEV